MWVGQFAFFKIDEFLLVKFYLRQVKSQLKNQFIFHLSINKTVHNKEKIFFRAGKSFKSLSYTAFLEKLN